MKPVLRTEKECEVCGKCLLACKERAICFKAGKINYYPEIDFSKCAGCRKCEAVCNEEIDTREKKMEFWIGYSRDVDVQHNSSSGGIFSELARHILEKRGIVFGATFDSDAKQVRHIGATKWEDVARLRKSKYVQSSWIDILPQVEKSIKEQRWILFTGTPCQVETMKKFYGSYSRIIFMDLFCHGVLNAGVFRSYLELLSKDNTYVDFRSESSCDNFELKIWNEKEILVEQYCSDNVLYQLFINSAGLKHSCFTCRYADRKHMADITVGDFDDREYAESRGIYMIHPSIIGINSIRGMSIFNEIKDKLIAVKIDKYTKKEHWFTPHELRKGSWGYEVELQDTFEQNYIRRGFPYAAVYSAFPEDAELIDKVNSGTNGKKLYFYGAGKRGERILNLINILGVKWDVQGYVVTSKNEKVCDVNGIPVYGISELKDKKSNIIVTVSRRYKSEIVEELRKRKFKNVFV